MSLHDLVVRFGDEEWLALLIESLRSSTYRGADLPGFPPESMQRQFGGSAGEHTLREAFNFYRVVKRYCAKHHPLTSDSRVLDFGCGWGRISRFFIKDVPPSGMHGFDVDPEVAAVARRTVGNATFSVVQSQPPTNAAADSFDVIFAYSVFSHLAEEVHLEWVREFSRVLRPGGLLVVTTQGRAFLELCRTLQGQTNFENGWHEALARAFPSVEDAARRYDDGEFLFSGTGGGDFRPSTFYGETLIPRAYVLREWTKHLQFRDFIDEPSLLPQALIVMQKAER